MREWTRRALNFSVAAVSLVLVSPLFLVIAAAVKLSSPGPVFFFQDRVGLDQRRRPRDRRVRSRSATDRREGDSGGRIFRMYKFRTMYLDEGRHAAGLGEEGRPEGHPGGPGPSSLPL